MNRVTLIKEILQGKRVLTNKEVSLYEVIKYLLANENITSFKIMVGYFWYFKELEELLKIIKEKNVDVKILMGNQTSPETVEIFEKALIDENKECKFNTTLLIDLLKKQKIQCKFPKKESNLRIHSKVYIFKQNSKIKYALIGSANLTKPGTLEKYEAVELARYENFEQLEEIFDEIWDDENLTTDPAHLEFIRGLPGIASIPVQKLTENEVISYFIWILDKEKISQKGRLTPLQHDEYQKVSEILDKYKGVFLTSSVGTGKSYVIKEAIREYLSSNNYYIFLIAPTTIIGKDKKDSQWYNVLVEEPAIKEKIEIFGEENIDKGLEKLKKDNEIPIWLIGIGAIRSFSETQQEKFKEILLEKVKHKEILFIIDEAHHFRNPDSKATSYIIKLLKELDKFQDTKVLLSTATPLNIRLEDLVTLFKIAFKDVRTELKEGATDNFPLPVEIEAEIKSYENLEKLLEDYNPQDRENLLVQMREKLFVKHDWQDVFSSPKNLIALIRDENKYKNLEKIFMEGKKGKELFDEVITEKVEEYQISKTPLYKLWNDIKEKIPDLFFVPYCFAHVEEKTPEEFKETREKEDKSHKYKIEKINKNTGIIKRDNAIYAIYFLNKEGKINLIFSPERVKNLHATYKIILAKRAESSLYSFLITLLRYLFKNFIFKKTLEEGNISKDKLNKYLNEFHKNYEKHIEVIKKIKGKIYAEDIQESEEKEEKESYRFTERLEKEAESLISNLSEFLKLKDKIPKIKFKHHDRYKNIIEILADDFKVLNNLANESYAILKNIVENKFKDPKIEKLIKIIKKSQKENKKLLAFSFFADTLDYIEWYLKKEKVLPQNSIFYTADTRDWLPASTLAERFNNIADDKKRIDYIFATDVLSEGVNLGEAKIFVNYDIEFNPVRIIQRAGRTMRIKWFAEKLSEGKTLEDIKKELYLIIPKDDIVSETVAKILDKVENRLSVIVSLIGLDYVLMHTEKIKKGIKNYQELKKILKEVSKKTEITEKSEYLSKLQELFAIYTEKVRRGEIKDVYKEVLNFYRKVGIINKNNELNNIKKKEISHPILENLIIQTEAQGDNKKLYIRIQQIGEGEEEKNYTPEEWGRKLENLNVCLKYNKDNRKYEVEYRNPQHMEKILPFFELILKGR